jgi:IS30 family transposase
VAQQAAWDRARRPKPVKLAVNRALADSVAGKLRQRWSPEEIACRLKRTCPGDENRRESHATVYPGLFTQARGALKKELIQHLRRSRALRRSRHNSQNTANHGRITDAVSIRERPAEVEARAVPGHWEGDLLLGGRSSQIATLVERHTRQVMLVKVASRDIETVINALISQARRLPREPYRSLTWDRRKEMADHRRFSLATDIRVYFCDPQSPWQRGSNEQVNGLLRQYFPKGMEPGWRPSEPPECPRQTARRAAQEDARLCNPSRTVQPMCCVDRLQAQSKTDVPRSRKIRPRAGFSA